MKNAILKRAIFILITAGLSFIMSFFFFSMILRKRNIKSIKDTAYCITVKDYLTKLQNKKIFFKNKTDYKSTLYLFKNMVLGEKKILKNECPDIYQESVYFLEHHRKIF